MDLFDTIPTLQDRQIILRKVTEEDADALERFCRNEAVYRCLPTFLYEQQEPDKKKVIRGMYTECIGKKESIHLGVYLKKSSALQVDDPENAAETENQTGRTENAGITADQSAYAENVNGEIEYSANEQFCGIAEIYNYEPDVPKVSIGYRLAEEFWGQGIATRVVGLLTDYLMNDAGIKVITAHVMVENVASGKALLKNRYRKRILNAKENWGFTEPVLVDKYVYKKEYFE